MIGFSGNIIKEKMTIRDQDGEKTFEETQVYSAQGPHGIVILVGFGWKRWEDGKSVEDSGGF